MALLLVGALLGCPTGENDSVCEEPTTLFGAPNASTGLDTDACTPTCTSCADGAWTQPTYASADYADWRAWTLENPHPLLDSNPYELAPPTPPDEAAVCGMLPSAPSYRLVDYPSTEAALAAGAAVTHFGRCGMCSSLADLAVYAEQPDLTEPVRACGMANLDGDIPALSACIGALGFTEPCAQIWAYNTVHTRDACLAVCLTHYDSPYNEADGSLNPCLQCDEDESGAVFQAAAGRTRRNTGLASSMCRPCSEVRPLEHRYGAP